MSRERTLKAATLLTSALVVSLVAAGCNNNRADRDDVSARGDTSRTYGGTTPSDTTGIATDTGRQRDTSRSYGGTTPSRSLDSDRPTTTRRRSTSTRRMTDQERQLYQQGQWDTTRLQQDTTRLQQQAPLNPTQKDTSRTDTTSFGNLAPSRDTAQANQLQDDTSLVNRDTTMGISPRTDTNRLQQDTLIPDTLRPRPDSTLPDTTRKDDPTQVPGDTVKPQQPQAGVTTPTQGDTAKQDVQQQPIDVNAPRDTIGAGREAVRAEGEENKDAGEPTDAQIVALTIAANTADSSAGELAQNRAQDPQVREFARMMVQDHGAANQRIQELVRRLNIRPDTAWGDNRTLLEESRDQVRELQSKNGAEFDREYIDQEVDMHQDVLEKLDEDLIPKADNAELKTLLQETRQSVQRHLDRARELQNTLRRR